MGVYFDNLLEGIMMGLRSRSTRQLIAALAVALFVSPVFAEKPQKAGEGMHKQKSHYQKPHDDFRRADSKHYSERQFQKKQQDRYIKEHYFDDRRRNIVGSYYRNEFRLGRCPPGLAKKHNGCLPPGQAKRWTLGRPLPRDVIFYDLPASVIRQIGYPPPGYRFVRVASDILMITIGTGLVVDAIADLNAMP